MALHYTDESPPSSMLAAMAAMTLSLLLHGRFHEPDLEMAHTTSIHIHWREFNHMSMPNPIMNLGNVVHLGTHMLCQ